MRTTMLALVTDNTMLRDNHHVIQVIDNCIGCVFFIGNVSVVFSLRILKLAMFECGISSKSGQYFVLLNFDNCRLVK